MKRRNVQPVCLDGRALLLPERIHGFLPFLSAISFAQASHIIADLVGINDHLMPRFEVTLEIAKALASRSQPVSLLCQIGQRLLKHLNGVNGGFGQGLQRLAGIGHQLPHIAQDSLVGAGILLALFFQQIL